MPSEARALIEACGLQQVCERPFRVHQRDRMRVIVSGIGSHACAAAVGWAAALDSSPAEVWVNFGIAGSDTYPVGSAVLAGRVTRTNGPGCHYPALNFASRLPVASVLSCDEPATRFPADTVCDLEAFGFCEAANRVSSCEFIQLVKVVSDNSTTGLGAINRDFVRAICEQQVTTVLDVATTMSRIASEPRVRAHITELPPGVHFTQTQARQFRTLSARLQALASDAHDLSGTTTGCETAATILDRLHARIRELSPRWPA